MRLQVDGLRCASCVWVVEGVLARCPGVSRAQVSYATGRANLTWDPAEVDLPKLAGTIQALGYRPRILGEEARPDRTLLVRLGVATFAAMNVMLLQVSIYAGWFDGMAPRFEALFQWAALVLATPVAIWAASPFFQGAIAGLRRGALHMDLPISLAVAVLYLHGLVTTVGGFGDGYLDSLTMLVALLLAGRVLEGHGRRRAGEAAASLASELPATARRHTPGGSLETVSTEALVPGDLVDVGRGEEFPADGVVVRGTGLVSAALVTGESEPARVGPEALVFGGTILVDGALEVRVTDAGGASLVRRMARELEDAASRPMTPTSSDRIAPWFTLVTLGAATATLAGWWATAGWSSALTATVAVLVVACPCALALSHPLTAAAALGAAARRGLLLRSGDSLSRLAEVDTAILDKTGTVTTGRMTVTGADDATLRIAAGLERYSGHPIARAVVDEAVKRGIPLPKAEGVEEVPGEGISGRVDGELWSLGSGGPGVLRLERHADTGEFVPAGEVRLGDVLRSDAAASVRDLRELGLRVMLRTGDRAETAAAIADAAGIDDWAGELSPEDKAAEVRAAREAGRRVLFAGDGINDGPALAAADAAVAMGSGAASSILVADGVVGSESLAPVAAGIRAARLAGKLVRVNQVRSMVYNAVAVGMAAAGWVDPLIAAILMPLSSALVMASAAGLESRVRAETGGPGGLGSRRRAARAG
jgi:Cu2+-exporting ATPase